MTADFPSRKLDKFILRLPNGMRDAIAASAKANNRSMNAEIILRLQKSFSLTAQPGASRNRPLPRTRDTQSEDELPARLLSLEEFARECVEEIQKKLENAVRIRPNRGGLKKK